MYSDGGSIRIFETNSLDGYEEGESATRSIQNTKFEPTLTDVVKIVLHGFLIIKKNTYFPGSTLKAFDDGRYRQKRQI
jgi:hypothetical protein